MRRVALQPAYVLHRRSYRETSFLVEVFTPEYGRLTLTAKGARQMKSATQGLLQPFTPLLISWAGKGELMTLTQVEVHGALRRLHGDALFAGFYLNELIMALLEKWDPHPPLFNAYDTAITAMQQVPINQQALRTFEKTLLGELGYGLMPDANNVHNTVSFEADKYYRFVPEQGFVISELGVDAKDKPNLFSGASLQAIAADNWQEESIRDAKRLTRFVLAPLLGNRTIHSRKLFIQPGEANSNEE